MGGAANHPCRAGATYLGAKVVGTDAAGVIHDNPRHIFFLSRVGFVAAGAAAKHPSRAGAGRFLIWARGFVAVDADAHHPRRTGTTCPTSNYLHNAWLIQ
jgi:hypothetical protein